MGHALLRRRRAAARVDAVRPGRALSRAPPTCPPDRRPRTRCSSPAPISSTARRPGSCSRSSWRRSATPATRARRRSRRSATATARATSMHERFLRHRTIFPHDFLADFGFVVVRRQAQVELARLELGGLVPVVEGRRAKVMRVLREVLSPQPVPAPRPAVLLRRLSALAADSRLARGQARQTARQRAPGRRGGARRSGSRSAPRPCAGCRTRRTGRGRSRPSDRGGSARRAHGRSRRPCAARGHPRAGRPATREELGRRLRRQRLLRLDPDRLGVPDEDRHADAGCRDRQVRQPQHLAALLADLRLLVELDSVEVPVHAQIVVGGRLGEQPLHRARAGTRHRLVGRDADAGETSLRGAAARACR